MKKLILLLGLVGCIDHTQVKSEVWVSRDVEIEGAYCVVFEGGGERDLRPYQADLRCGLNLRDALEMRDQTAKEYNANPR